MATIERKAKARALEALANVMTTVGSKDLINDGKGNFVRVTISKDGNETSTVFSCNGECTKHYKTIFRLRMKGYNAYHIAKLIIAHENRTND